MNNLKYLYVRNLYRNRDVTIVSNLTESDGKYYVNCGWAFRSNHDIFVKKEGRKLALERMNSSDPEYSATFLIENPKFFDISSNVLSAIIQKSSTPRKYIKDLTDDLFYFSHCAVNGVPKFPIFNK